MASRIILDCVPELQEKYYAWAELMSRAGLKHKLTCTLRTQAEQSVLFMQGRGPIERVNGERIKIGLIPIRAEDNIIVTKLKTIGKHGEGKAFDIALMKHIGGDKETVYYNLKISVNDNDIPDYKEAADLGVKAGLQNGGLLWGWDFCHYEI